MKTRMKTMTFIKGRALSGIDVNSSVREVAIREYFTQRVPCGED